MDNVYHLFARHPELARNQEFLLWLKEHGFSYWYDTPPAEGDVKVVVVSRDEASLYAALERLPEGEAAEHSFLPEMNLVTVGEADLTRLPPRETVLRNGAAQFGFSRSDVISIRPDVSFEDGRLVLKGWEVQVAGDGRRLHFAGSDDLGEAGEDALPAATAPRRAQLIPPGADDMADNDLHTLSAFRQEAEAWTQGPLTISEKARRIGEQVSRTYSYDGSINMIADFTWRDTLTRDRNGRRGICDEYAVVQITCLRSIGIPARLKFLAWIDGAGKGVAHACLEFSDNGTWYHMDGLWNAFKDPGRYRQSGARNLTVMDADYPSDSRSDEPAWGTPDIRGDGLLYPYGDFIINPAWPGNQRPGYSY